MRVSLVLTEVSDDGTGSQVNVGREVEDDATEVVNAVLDSVLGALKALGFSDVRIREAVAESFYGRLPS